MTDPKNIVPDSYYDSLYERNENVSTKECPECDGTGKVYFSDCCGAEIIDEFCTDCKATCLEESDVCEVCKGEGEISA